MKSGSPDSMFLSVCVCSVLKHWLQLFTGAGGEAPIRQDLGLLDAGKTKVAS